MNKNRRERLEKISGLSADLRKAIAAILEEEAADGGTDYIIAVLENVRDSFDAIDSDLADAIND